MIHSQLREFDHDTRYMVGRQLSVEHHNTANGITWSHAATLSYQCDFCRALHKRKQGTEATAELTWLPFDGVDAVVIHTDNGEILTTDARGAADLRPSG